MNMNTIVNIAITLNIDIIENTHTIIYIYGLG